MSYVDNTIYSILTGNAGVTAIAGTRIRMGGLIAQDDTYPLVLYKRTGTERVRNSMSSSGAVTATYDIGCFAKTKHMDAVELANAVRLAIDGYSGGANGIQIQKITLSNDIDDPKIDDETEQGWLYGVSYEATVKYVETAVTWEGNGTGSYPVQVPGPQGPAGASGSDGEDGPTGPQGPAGADGTPYWQRVGTVLSPETAGDIVQADVLASQTEGNAIAIDSEVVVGQANTPKSIIIQGGYNSNNPSDQEQYGIYVIDNSGGFPEYSATGCAISTWGMDGITMYPDKTVTYDNALMLNTCGTSDTMVGNNTGTLWLYNPCFASDVLFLGNISIAQWKQITLTNQWGTFPFIKQQYNTTEIGDPLNHFPLVAVTDTAIINDNALGTERINNGTPTGTTHWSLPADWTYDNGWFKHDANIFPHNGMLVQTAANMVTPLVAGEWYQLTFYCNYIDTGGIFTLNYGGIDILSRYINVTGSTGDVNGYVSFNFKASISNGDFYIKHERQAWINQISIKRITGGNLQVVGDLNIGTVHVGTAAGVDGSFTAGGKTITVTKGIITGIV